MHQTSYAEVDRLLESLVFRIRAVLHEKLVGVYLYGSLVTGDFDPGISDVDLLAVTSSDLDNSQVDALRTLHRDIAIKHPEWDDRVEVAYVSMTALRTFRSEKHQIAVISPGEPFHVKELDSGYLMNWYVVRERGVVLFGPPVNTVIGPVTREEYVQTVRDYVSWLAGNLREVMDRKYQAYAILAACRALYLHRKGAVTSKRRAALWALEELPEWSGLIQSALAWRKAWRDEQVDHAATHAESLRFVTFVRGLVLDT
ncbi:MAG: aminoglycoside adenylyltransferase domain-containing protein [Dehalococcoidia bacterium]